MTGQKYCVCGTSQAQDCGVGFHHIRKNPDRRVLWLKVFGVSEKVIKPSTRICARHFPGGDVEKILSMFLGEMKIVCMTV